MSIRTLSLVWLAIVSIVCTTPLRSSEASPSSSAPGGWFEKIDTGKLVEVYAPSETANWRVVLRNRSDQSLAGAKLSWRTSNWETPDDSASPPSAAASFLDVPKLAPGASCELTVRIPLGSLGWHAVILELRGSGDDTLIERHVRTLSVGETPRSTGRYFRYGLCSHMIRQTGTRLFDIELELARQLGIDTIRTELAAWGSVERVEGQFDFSKPDNLLAALQPHGIQVESILAYSTRWGSTGDPNAKDWSDWSKTAPRLEPWLNYVGKVVERYGDRIDLWEIWNEPDISFWRASTESYVELFNASSALIKKKSPRAQVLNGGLAMASREPNPDFVSRFVASASPAHWDIFAYHDYHSFAQFLARRSEVETHQKALRKNLPAWINEGGYHSLLAGGEHSQTLTLVKKIAASPAFGVKAYFWYNLRDDGLDPKDPEHHFGLVRYDGQPKPAWSAYQALIRELGAARYLRSMSPRDVPAGAWAQLYQRDAASDHSAGSASKSSHVLVLWQEGAARRIPHWLGVGPDARVTGVRDLMGNPVTATISAQGAVFDLTEEPVYVQIDCAGSDSPMLALRSLIEPPPLIVLVPGQTTSAILRLNNPFDQPVTLRIAWESSLPGLHVAPSASEFTVPARGQVEATASLHLDAGPVNVITNPRLVLRLTIPETGLVSTAHITAMIALPVPALPATAVILLNKRDDIHNLYSAEPLPAMQWSGPADLSATARLAYDQTGLDLVVEVRDDIHRQPNVSDKLWAADSLQLGLKLDDTHNTYVEIGLARTDDRNVGGWVFATDANIPLTRGRLKAPARFDVTRDDHAAITTYHLYLPWSELGRNRPPADGFRLNLIVNDDDGLGRKQWVQLSEGLGEQKNPGLWNVFTCR